MSQLSLINNLSRAKLYHKPFPHFVINNALSPSIYKKLEDAFPDHYLNLESNIILDDRGHTRRLLYKNFKDSNIIDPIWNEFAHFHCSTSFFRTLTTFFFEEYFHKYYPSLLNLLNSIPVSLRTNNPLHDKKNFVTDFQFVANIPISESHTSRTPHLDNPKEIYACLFYMRKKDDTSIGGGLDLYQPRKSALTAHHTRDRAIDPMHLKHYKTLHYSPNTAVIFLNTRFSYHGVQPIFNQHVNRRSLNIIGELPLGKQLFQIDGSI